MRHDRKGRNMGERPDHLRPPAHLSPSPPVPQPAEARPEPEPDDRPPPTRYGDWERNGIAIDF
jgi:hypothetical protein